MRAVCDISIFLVVQAVVTPFIGPDTEVRARARAHVFGDDEKGGEDNSSHVRRSEKFHPRRRKCSRHERAGLGDNPVIRNDLQSRSFPFLLSRSFFAFVSLLSCSSFFSSLSSCLFFPISLLFSREAQSYFTTSEHRRLQKAGSTGHGGEAGYILGTCTAHTYRIAYKRLLISS